MRVTKAESWFLKRSKIIKNYLESLIKKTIDNIQRNSLKNEKLHTLRDKEETCCDAKYFENFEEMDR